VVGGSPAVFTGLLTKRDRSGVIRCDQCGGVKFVYFVHVYIVSLSLGPEPVTTCTCDQPTGASFVACGECHEANCTAACPLRSSGARWRDLQQRVGFYPASDYPSANFARPTNANPREILAGSSTGGELGAYGFAKPSQRLRMFREGLDESLPFGAGYRVDFRS
jgi:hypothetical protein